MTKHGADGPHPGLKPSSAVGVIGLGVMGHAIATRLLSELGAVAVHDVRPEVANELVDKGGIFCGTPSDLAAQCDVVVLSLNTASIVEQVVFGDSGVLEGRRDNDGLIIDMSSIAPGCTREFARRVGDLGVSWVDAPLSGGTPGALAGRLSVMAGGDPSAVARARTVLNHLASRITHAGDSGAGQTVKLINQMLVGIGFSTLAEIAALTRATRLDPQAVLSSLTGGRADSALLQEFFVKFAATDLTPTGNVANMVKDLETATAAACSEGLTVPLTELALAQNRKLVASGHGAGDNVNLMRLYGPVNERAM